MINYDQLIRLGERLQLTGADLADFIRQKEEEYYAREERAFKREEERRAIERQHEINLNAQQIELQRLKARNSITECTSAGPRPKLPKYEEGKDDMDAYIERFERFAEGQGWNKETWATSLSTLLSGKGLEVYTSLPPEEANDYAALKIAILKRYQLTEEGFRTKFRSIKPEVGETAFQFLARLMRYFMRWIEMAKADVDLPSLCDLMIRDQLMESSSPELATFLKERAPGSVAQATRLAEQYIEARGGQWNTEGAMTEARQSGASKPGQYSKENAKPNRECFICGKIGHIARDCRQTNTTHKREKILGAVGICRAKDSEQRTGGVTDEFLKLENGDSLPFVSDGYMVPQAGGGRNPKIQQASSNEPSTQWTNWRTETYDNAPEEVPTPCRKRTSSDQLSRPPEGCNN